MNIGYERNEEEKRGEFIFSHAGKYSPAYIADDYPMDKYKLLTDWLNRCFEQIDDQAPTHES